MFNIIFLGAPGSGKGSQALMLSKELAIPTISTGDILRFEVNKKSKIGLLAKQYINKGNLVPDSVVVDIIREYILQKDCDRGFILDGFPRTLSQAFSLDANLLSINRSISCVISLEVPDDIIVQRISGRFFCSNCKTLYNKFFNNVKKNGVCDVCESNTMIFRDDDNEEVVTNRLAIYHYNTKEIISFYEKKDLIYRVDGLKTIELVQRDIRKVIDLST